MKISVTPSALAWFQTEWGFHEGDNVRFFARYGGSSTVQDSFSMGIMKEEPKHIAISTIETGITFYLEQDDIWYLDGKDLTVNYSPEKDEILFEIS